MNMSQSDKQGETSNSQHSSFEQFLCSESRCRNLANEAAIDFEMPMDILGNLPDHSVSKITSDYNDISTNKDKQPVTSVDKKFLS